MDNFRLILLLSLAAVLFLIYQAWVQDYGQPTQPQQIATTEAPPAGDEPSAVPTDQTVATPTDTPDAPPVAAAQTPSSPTAGRPAATVPPAEGTAELVTVETDVLRAEISTRGGTLQALWLKDYPAVANRPDVPLQLLKPDTPNMFIAQSGLLGNADTKVPTHNDVFTAERTSYRLKHGEDDLLVELVWRGDDGVEVTKRYRFKRGSYLIRAEQSVNNGSDHPVAIRNYDQLQRTELIDPNEARFVRTYTGGAYYGPDVKYKKETFEDMDKRPLDVTITGGWIAMLQHYFMAAWIPDQDLTETFYSKVVGSGHYIIGKYSPTETVPAGANYTFENKLFAGPKLQDELDKIADGLDLAVDYGWLTVLARPIFWLLEMIHRLVGNWGWSIIILTILIKGSFYKLSEASYKSMAHMRKVAPRLKALKDRYGDDKERLNQAMMDLYKKEKINPLGGCLPILVQIPVFISLYWVLLKSVEMRYAPFMLWIHNLSAPDPYYVLPLIMGVSMFVQQKLNPPPPDPMQEKLFMALPFVFTVFFAFFPAGLVLYWTVNNLLSIAQQWYITRKIEREDAAKHRA
ncbi:MAG: membrane protein insertase YidC [Thiohalocapsa sp.]|jgi:YidC/Oxa1 family membrane protein insertase|uniref:membrane protein insertase YidC n=1 Tax=Thiohalocapsa sp. TaxID=2497641 RepID=UPI0025D01158|nr:membrane protein insertase YidC [Thiohalocapsa sp.]MCG6941234.1 membrane protein insertase YidC [Thiohalocapsa sp.]